MNWFGVFTFVSVFCVGTGCQDGWLSHGAKCYHFSREQETWPSAVQMCSVMKGNLVEVKDLSVFNYLQNQAKLQESRNYWMALSDVVEEGTWVWMNSGERLTAESFSNWYPGEPNNINNHEDCAILYSVFGYNWADAPCNTNQYYICEQDNSDNHIIG